MINEHFEGVDVPQEGDLVVYYKNEEPVHAGIFRKPAVPSRPGIVESTWCTGFVNPYVFQHDFFLLPDYFGETLKIFRFTNKPKDCWPKKIDDSKSSMYTSNQGVFQFIPTQENQAIRKFIDQTRDPHALAKQLPELQVTDIWFIGRCHKYALTELLPGYIYKHPSLSEKSLFGTQKSTILDKYFTLVSDPKPGDLAVYSEKAYRIHYGVYIAPNLIESKWGPGSIYRHPPFYVDSEYGNTITFYRLKPGATFTLELEDTPGESNPNPSPTIDNLLDLLNSGN